MGLDFRIRDFGHPIALLRTKRQFDRNPYLSLHELEAYQCSLMQKVLRHAYANVPYYQLLFNKHGIHPSRIRKLQDFARLPFLTKRTLSQSFAGLTAANVQAYGPSELRTSGTTGGQVRFLVDRASNVLEFVYYWRFWGWHGYRLGSRFAELSAESFLPIDANRERYVRLNPLLNRILLNSLLLSRANALRYVAILQEYRPFFLKGLPSNLYVLALLCDGVGKHGITFRAIFSQGENLPDGQRRFISRVFSAPVYDSYGHMERTAAISQCPHGTYHIHSDFGLVELVEPRNQVELPMSLAPGQAVREVVGTSLHNLSMPLIRYRTGDLVLVDCGCPPCPCGRSFPMVRAILGRDTDIVTTSDGRAITALYAAMDRVAGIRCSQIIQESADTLLVRIACDGPAKPALRQSVERTIQSFTGTSTRVVVHECESEEIYARRERKFKSVVSHVPPLSVTP